MDISHITNLLSSLGKNQVTIPILSNDFIETKVDNLYVSVLNNDIFDLLDDMNKELQMNKGKQYKQKKPRDKECYGIVERKNSDAQHSNRMIYTNIIHLFACIHDNTLMFDKNPDKISLFTNAYLRSLINYVNEQVIRSIIIDDRKLTKATIVQDLSNIINDINLSDNTENFKLLISLSSKYLMKHIILVNVKGDVVYSEFDYNTNEFEDVVIIIKSDTTTECHLDDIIKTDVYKDDYVKKNINEIKLENNYKENLKSLSVKDLRIIAKKLCIDIIDAHTSKLYSKVDLRLLIEAKINSI